MIVVRELNLREPLLLKSAVPGWLRPSCYHLRPPS